MGLYHVKYAQNQDFLQVWIHAHTQMTAPIFALNILLEAHSRREDAAFI